MTDGAESTFEVGFFNKSADFGGVEDRFYSELPPFGSFNGIVQREHYRALPDGWIVGVADIVNSTDAITSGKYREVNTVGAAVLAAVSNRLPGAQFPFVFTGDGASFALPGAHAGLVREILARTAAWAEDVFGLTLRAALVPIADIRAHGFDIRVARFAASSNVTYAMFAGGGLAWAERSLKSGSYSIPRAPMGVTADLTGLSCHFAPIKARRGIILSLLAVPREEPAGFASLVGDILRLLEADGATAHPLPADGPLPAWTGGRFDYLIRTGSRHAPLSVRAVACAWAIIERIAHFLGLPAGGFHAAKFRRELIDNTDYRKYDDGLRMTVDCTPEVADAIDARLATAQRQLVCYYGTYRQASANLTCFVRSETQSDHVHFVDGAAGGYAFAAAILKRNISNDLAAKATAL